MSVPSPHGRPWFLTVPLGNDTLSRLIFPNMLNETAMQETKAWLQRLLGDSASCWWDHTRYPQPNVIEITRHREYGARRNNDAEWRQHLADLTQPHYTGAAHAQIVQAYDASGTHQATHVVFRMTEPGIIDLTDEQKAGIGAVAEWDVQYDHFSKLCLMIDCTLRESSLLAEEVQTTAIAIESELMLLMDNPNAIPIAYVDHR